MDIKGVTVSVEAAKQSDEWLVSTAEEIAKAARERGLELPAFAGAVAVGGAAWSAEVVPEVDAKAGAEAKVDPTEIREAIFDQLDVALKGHTDIVGAINANRKRNKVKAASPEVLQAELTAWLTEARVIYWRERMEAQPGVTFRLIATPNVKITADEFIAVARKFGEDQPRLTDIWSDIHSQCTPEEISGTDPKNGNTVVFDMVPEQFTPELFGTPQTQVDNLAEMRTANPFLEAPAPFKDLTYVYTERQAKGGTLAGPGTADLTYMRDFTIEPRLVGKRRCVPLLVVDGYGQLIVGRSRVRNVYCGRALVG